MFRSLIPVACALLLCGPVLAGDYIPGIGPEVPMESQGFYCGLP